MQNKILYTLPLFFILLLSVACNRTKQEIDTTSYEVDEEIEYVDWDSIYRAQEKQRERDRRAAIPPHKRAGKYDVNDSIYLGEILITIDSVERKVVTSKYENSSLSQALGGRNYSYDMYLSITNVSDSIELEIPFVFFDKTQEERNRHAYSESEYMYYFGTRMFYDKGKNNKVLGTNNYKIRPGKTRTGRYHMMNRGSISTLFFSFGDPDEDDAANVPYYYYHDGMSAYVNISSKIVQIEETKK